MDRSRGSSSNYRGSTKYTSSYSSRNFEDGRSSHSFSNNASGYRGPKDYDNYSSEHGMKRRYDQMSDHRKPYDHHGGREGSPRKYYRSDNSHGYEGRSNHHRSQHESSNTSSSRGRYYSNGSSDRHDADSYHSQRRFDDNRRYHQSSSSTSYRGSGGYASPRGRGRARGTYRPQLHTSRHHSRERDYKSDKEHSRSPTRHSGDEASFHASDTESKLSQEQLDAKKEDASSEKNAVEHSEGDKSTRNEQGPKEQSDEHPRERSADRASHDGEKDSKRERSVRHSEPDRSPKKSSSSKDPPEHFIRLQCPHCNQRCVTFREYILHLSSKRHADALEKVSLQHRMSLAKLRTRQRKEQLQIEAQSAKPQHSSRMNFCAICKLYHSESRPNHETTELHKIIKNFLMPFCPICRVHFKSRMLYEKHVATLTHIKNKVNMEKTYERRREEERKHERNGQEKEEVFNLENFMTLDAVGSVDGDEENTVAFEETPVGQDFVKKIETYYCDVCKRYLARMEPLDKVIELHCRTRAHHTAYATQCSIKKEILEEETNTQPDVDNHTRHDDEEGSEMKRSDSQERLWQETENDIGGLDEEANLHDDEGALQIAENAERDDASRHSVDGKDSEESNNMLHEAIVEQEQESDGNDGGTS